MPSLPEARRRNGAFHNGRELLAIGAATVGEAEPNVDTQTMPLVRSETVHDVVATKSFEETVPTTQVAVCGPGHCTIEDQRHAFRVGQLLAERGVTVICGGGTGVMAAVAREVRFRNGVIIGVRPGPDKPPLGRPVRGHRDQHR